MTRQRRSKVEREVDRELIAKGRAVADDFDQDAAITMQPERVDTKLISIRLPLEMLQGLRAAARRKGDIGYQQLIKLYLADALRKSTDVPMPAHAQEGLYAYLSERSGSRNARSVFESRPERSAPLSVEATMSEMPETPYQLLVKEITSCR